MYTFNLFGINEKCTVSIVDHCACVLSELKLQSDCTCTAAPVHCIVIRHTYTHQVTELPHVYLRVLMAVPGTQQSSEITSSPAMGI